MTATKQQLREEIAALRLIGSQMANLCFNLGQNARYGDFGRMVSGPHLADMYNLSQQWDAIKKSEQVKRLEGGQ